MHIRMDVTITKEQAEALIAFIRNHERSEIADDVWDACQDMMDATETDTSMVFSFAQYGDNNTQILNV